MKSFFKRIGRDDLILGWEPRGTEWSTSMIKELCKSLRLIHITDPFKQLPIYAIDNIVYLRLHGSPPGKKIYSYKYTREDFNTLVEKLDEIKSVFPKIERIYVMFNNIYMREDGLAFQKFLNDRGYRQI